VAAITAEVLVIMTTAFGESQIVSGEQTHGRVFHYSPAFVGF
jgi:hypothetical protein